MRLGWSSVRAANITMMHGPTDINFMYSKLKSLTSTYQFIRKHNKMT